MLRGDEIGGENKKSTMRALCAPPVAMMTAMMRPYTSTPAMTTGMIDFTTRSGFITPIEDTPTPDGSAARSTQVCTGVDREEGGRRGVSAS